MKSFKQYIKETKLNPVDPNKDYAAKSKVLQDLSKNKDVDQKSVQQRRLDLDKEYSKLKSEACWDRYEQRGMKKKGNRMVPNCVPVKEDGMAGTVAGPTNAVSSGAIAGTGGKGGEPGVTKKKNPILKPMARRNPPQ
jgi:hypothetical protein